jgi:type I restriction enzyme R subunit
VIVRDMWLTGFDAPCCHTMYVDKPMKGHNLMQAIARVNRVFKNKPGGLVVDYIGIANELKAALKTYTEAKGKGDPTHNAAEALAVLLEKMDIVRGMMHGCDYSGFETKAAALLVPCANHLLGLKDGKQRFLDTMVAVAKAYSLCGTLDEAAALRKEIAFFSAIKAAITKFTTVDKKRSTEEKNSALKQILDNAIVADGVADIFALAGLDKPNIGLLSDEFLEDVRQMESRNLAVELAGKAAARRDQGAGTQQRGAGEEVRRPLAGNPAQVPQPRHRDGTGHRRADPDGQGIPGGAGTRSGTGFGAGRDRLLRCAGQQRERGA